MEIECVMFDWIRTCVILNVCDVPHQEEHLCALTIHNRGEKTSIRTEHGRATFEHGRAYIKMEQSWNTRVRHDLATFEHSRATCK